MLAHLWPLFNLFDSFVEELIHKKTLLSDDELYKASSRSDGTGPCGPYHSTLGFTDLVVGVS